MTLKHNSLQQALADLAVIRRTLLCAEQSSDERPSLTSISLNIILQVVACGFAAIIAMGEIVKDNLGTKSMLFSASNVTLQHSGIVTVGLFLLMLLAVFCLIIWRAARESELDFTTYVAQHYPYLKDLSLISDLLVKFCFFVAVILAGKPEWVAPIFLLFTGDYLIQKRFFVLPSQASLLAGTICYVGAIIQFSVGSPLMVWPLLAFSVASLCSIAHLISLRRNAVQDDC